MLGLYIGLNSTMSFQFRLTVKLGPKPRLDAVLTFSFTISFLLSKLIYGFTRKEKINFWFLLNSLPKPTPAYMLKLPLAFTGLVVCTPLGATVRLTTTSLSVKPPLT